MTEEELDERLGIPKRASGIEELKQKDKRYQGSQGAALPP